MVKGAGTIFTTVGTGGVVLRPIGLGDPTANPVVPPDPELGYFAACSGSNVKPSWGSLLLTATSTQLSARFAPVSSERSPDTFSISSSPALLPPDADAGRRPRTRPTCAGCFRPGDAARLPDYLLGTLSADRITGTGWADTISGLGGNDLCAWTCRQ